MTYNPDALVPFRSLYNSMTAGTRPDLSQVYTQSVRFQDPFAEITGRESLAEYLSSTYSNVIRCRFDFAEPILKPDQACLPWTMHLQHRRLRNGEEVHVDGISLLRLEGALIAFHRDYFDAGQLLYENVPVLGNAVRWLRRRVA